MPWRLYSHRTLSRYSLPVLYSSALKEARPWAPAQYYESDWAFIGNCIILIGCSDLTESLLVQAAGNASLTDIYPAMAPSKLGCPISEKNTFPAYTNPIEYEDGHSTVYPKKRSSRVSSCTHTPSSHPLNTSHDEYLRSNDSIESSAGVKSIITVADSREGVQERNLVYVNVEATTPVQETRNSYTPDVLESDEVSRSYNGQESYRRTQASGENLKDTTDPAFETLSPSDRLNELGDEQQNRIPSLSQWYPSPTSSFLSSYPLHSLPPTLRALSVRKPLSCYAKTIMYNRPRHAGVTTSQIRLPVGPPLTVFLNMHSGKTARREKMRLASRHYSMCQASVTGPS